MNAQLVWSLLIKGSVILVAAQIASAAMRKRSASRRHLVWLGALCALILIPFAEIKLPNWDVPVAHSPMVAPLVAPMPLRPTAPKQLIAKDVYVLDVAAPFDKPVEATPMDWASIVWSGWLIGCAGFLGWTLFGLLQVLRLVRSGRRWVVPESCGQAIDSRIRVLICPSLRVPATAGVFRPLILLPEEAQIWGKRRLEMVLAHESAHIRRSDWLWQIVSQAACAIHFFNPLAWMAMRRLRTESEFACDDYVLGLGIEPASYAHELLDIARSSRFQFANTVGMARSRNVEGRLKSIIDARQQRTWASGRTFLGVLAVTALIVTPVALIKAIPSVIDRLTGAKKQIEVRHSRTPMPQIPWVASKEVAPNVFLAKDGIAGLPEGFRVKLVALSGETGDLWDLNSKAVPNARLWRGGGVYWQGNVFHRSGGYGYSPRFAALSREFYFEVESENDALPATTVDIVSPPRTTKLQKLNPIYAGADDRIPEIKLPAHDPAFAIIPLSLAAKTPTATIRFGIANADWTTVSDIRNPITARQEQIAKNDTGNGSTADDCGISLGDTPGLWYKVQGALRGTTVGLAESGTTFSGDLARRVLLFDKEGQPMALNLAPSYDMNGYPSYDVPAAMFCNIGRVVLQTSPYHWAEFRDVPIRPNFVEEETRRLDPGIRGTATGIAPGFSQTLANGVTVSLTAVTKAVLDGENWKTLGQPSWRGDGKVLAQGPAINPFPHPARTWSKFPLIRYDFQYRGAPADANMVFEALGEVDPSDWLKDRQRGDPQLVEYIETAYLPTAKSGGIRVGVATGPWKIVGRHPIDIEELPASHYNPDEPQREQTGFTVIRGEIPRLVFQSDKKEIPLTGKPLKECAVRVVAVLKSGETRVIDSAGSTIYHEPLYPVPGRHGEQTEFYNHLIASQVKEVQIQTRPYDWAEFRGIALSPK